jgi:hypothetical protein
MEHVDLEAIKGSVSKGSLENLENILRMISYLKKRLNQLCRGIHRDRGQYPEIFFEIETSLEIMRDWIQDYRSFCGVSSFVSVLILRLENLHILIESLLSGGCQGGKRGGYLAREQKRVRDSIYKILNNINIKLRELESRSTSMSEEFDSAVLKKFERYCEEEHRNRMRVSVSKRGEKTYIFPWSDKESYVNFVKDTERFQVEVVDKLGKSIHLTGHKPHCRSKSKYVLSGYRSASRKPVMEGGEQKVYPIRMVKCTDCGQRFSLVPSFLPREKHFGIDMIGKIIRGIVLFGHSIQSAIENFSLTGAAVKSRQTILNWIRWFGTLHPATVLTRAGVKGSGYFQEDEGFEKESGCRTYTVVMVDPENLLVWHLDYVDHVDEETLTESFEKFVEHINFNVLGVTKDKWEGSTRALKTVCHQVWIGFCHRHLFKKFRDRLFQYQKETGCSDRERKRLYKDFQKALNTGASKSSLEVQINFLKDEAYNHPLLRSVLDDVKKNAVRYASHKIRKGIKKTTSLVDNFLKIVKRKLRQVESFRDQESAGLLFRAMANVRNFVPFNSGAKNAHKSPFMLALGETHDLPWVQVMNVHNAFLFAENAV